MTKVKDEREFEEDVLKLIIDSDLNIFGRGIISVGIISKILNVSKYKVNKKLNVLLDKGLIQKSVLPGGIDEYSDMPYPPLKGYKITEKCKKTELFLNLQKKEEELIEEVFGIK